MNLSRDSSPSSAIFKIKNITEFATNLDGSRASQDLSVLVYPPSNIFVPSHLVKLISANIIYVLHHLFLHTLKSTLLLLPFPSLLSLILPPIILSQYILTQNEFQYKDDMSLLNSINEDWFINLSKSPISHEIQLLQLGDKFCLPLHHNSQQFTFNFIKNVEYNIQKLDLDTPSNIKCLSVQTLNKLLSSPPTPSIIDSRLIALTNKIKEFFL